MAYWLMYAGPAMAQVADPETVLGFNWGDRYKTCLNALKDRGVPVKGIKNESITYSLAGVQTQLEFDELLGLSTILVSKNFAESSPKEAQLYFNDELRSISRTFGEYDTHQTHTGQLHRFEWKLKRTAISLTYYIPAAAVTAEYSRKISL